jgi:hypothetical protein
MTYEARHAGISSADWRIARSSAWRGSLTDGPARSAANAVAVRASTPVSLAASAASSADGIGPASAIAAMAGAGARTVYNPCLPARCPARADVPALLLLTTLPSHPF